MQNDGLPFTGFVEMYDNMILAPEIREMYGNSGFYNVGEWSKNPDTLKAACRNLVVKHLDQANRHQSPVRVLDAGCGLGGGSAVIARCFSKAEVTAINISEKQISFAKQHYPGIDFRVMDATKMNFPPDYFDLIVCIEAVFHFATRKDFLKNALRILRPGGQLIFSDILFTSTLWVGEWSVPEANLVTDIKEYEILCAECGFRIRQCKDITRDSVQGFCNHLRKVASMAALADGFENSVKAYLLVSLEK